MDVDILNLDKKIQDFFKNQHKSILNIKRNYNSLIEYTNSLGKDNDCSVIKDICSDLELDIKEKSSQKKLNYYIMETFDIIEKYKKILTKPIKLSFTKVKKIDKKETETLIKQYLKIAEKYVNIDEFLSPNDIVEEKKKDKTITCENCKNKENFEIIENDIHICLVCFSEQVVPTHSSSYKDSDRINISSKYTYDRKIHFRDSIKQLQGKENATIEQKVFDDLEQAFKNHYLLELGENVPKHIRYKRISKQTILLFLKNLNYTKYYKNINLIHYRITGIKPDDVSHLEEKLLQDFDKLTELYDVMFKDLDRKNFINTKNILYQLLKRHKYNCKESDFSFLKTTDRKIFHDDISKQLFTKLGWNWSSINF